MSYFPDGSRYEFLAQTHPMINIGWLDCGHEFATGAVPDEVVTTLTVLALHQHNITRGTHNCHFCDEESPIEVPADVPRGFVWLGMGELHVVGTDGVTYSAPSLVIHYITRHGYQPPAEFIDAVQHGHPCELDCS